MATSVQLERQQEEYPKTGNTINMDTWHKLMNQKSFMSKRDPNEQKINMYREILGRTAPIQRGK